MAKGTHDPRYQSAIAGLAAARRRAGLSQAQLAQRLNQRQQFVSKYEAGERRLDIIEFVDVARALGLDWAELLEETA